MRNYPVIENALCIDLDDLGSSYQEAGVLKSHWDYVAHQETEDLLQELDNLRIKATFFVPGMFLKQAPTLVKLLSSQNHQVASHGIIHKPVKDFSPEEFFQDVAESKARLEDLSGDDVDTYKAPMWSIVPESAWAYDQLIRANYKYDHTAMPKLKKYLGVPTDQHVPFIYKDALVVIPPTTVRILGTAVPFCGGFFNARVPVSIQKRIFRRINFKGLPFNFYFHPFEHSPHKINQRWNKAGHFKMSLYAAHAGNYFLLLKKLSKVFRFTTLRQAYRNHWNFHAQNLDS